MITCPNCQAEMKEGNKFCIECGTPLTEQATQQKKASKCKPNYNYGTKHCY